VAGQVQPRQGVCQSPSTQRLRQGATPECSPVQRTQKGRGCSAGATAGAGLWLESLLKVKETQRVALNRRLRAGPVPEWSAREEVSELQRIVVGIPGVHNR
jgi:hypothetical protein